MAEEKKCGMDDPELKQCCCKCARHLAVHHHCCTSPKPEGVTGCVCHKGWACIMPEEGVIYDNWPEHSCGCELFEMKREETDEGC